MAHLLLRAAGRVLLVACLALAAGRASADDISRESALHDLIGRVDLPLAHQGMLEVLEALRAQVPATVLADLGTEAELGDRWKRGNPQFDKALDLIDRRIKQEIAAGRPVFVITRLDVERSLDLPWSEDDIRFVSDHLDKPAGRSLVQTLDANFTLGLLSSSRQELFTSDLERREANALTERARIQATQALTDFAALSESDAVDAARLKLLYESGVASATGINDMLQKAWQRRVNNLVADLMPALQAQIDDFKARP